MRNTGALGLGCASFVGYLPLGSVLMAPEKKNHQHLKPFLLKKTTSFWPSPSNYLCGRENCSLLLLLFVQNSHFLPRSTASGVIAPGGPHTPTLENPSQSCSVHLWHQGQRDTERVDHHRTTLMASVSNAMHNNGSLK